MASIEIGWGDDEGLPPIKWGGGVRNKLVNCTPHVVCIKGVEFPPSGSVAIARTYRAAIRSLDIEGIDALVDVNEVEYLDLIGLPDPVEYMNSAGFRVARNFYLVSSIAAQAAKAEGRTEDILVVDETIRDDSGRIVGAKSLAQV